MLRRIHDAFIIRLMHAEAVPHRWQWLLRIMDGLLVSTMHLVAASVHGMAHGSSHVVARAVKHMTHYT